MKKNLLLSLAMLATIITLNAQQLTRAYLITPFTLTNAFKCVVANQNGDMFYGDASNIAKMDSAGTEVFRKNFAGIGFLAYLSFTDLALGTDGNIIACGNFKQGFLIGTDTIKTRGPVGNFATVDGFVAKFNATNGNIIWFKNLGGIGNDNATSIAVNAAGDIYVTGNTQGGGGLQVTFDTINRLAVQTEVYLAKFKTDGSIYWVQRGVYVDNGYGFTSSGESVSTDAAGNVYVAGNWNGSGKVGTVTKAQDQNVYVFKFMADGSFGWFTLFETGGGGGLKSMSADAGGNTYMAGTCGNFGGITPGMTMPAGKCFFVKINADGSFGWKKIMGVNATTINFVVKTNSLNDVYLAGNFAAPFVLNSGLADSVSLTPGAASSSLYMAKFGASGDLKSSLASAPVTISSICNPLDFYITKTGKGYLLATITGNTKFNTLVIPGSGYLNPIFTFDAGGTTTTAVNETRMAGNELLLYPNPASSFIKVSIPGNNVQGTIQLLNLEGKTIREANMTGSETEVNLAGLEAGIYIVKVGSTMRKLLVQ